MGRVQRSCGKCGGFGCPWPSRCANCGKRTPGSAPRHFVVDLMRRHLGRHDVVKSARLLGRASDYVRYAVRDDGFAGQREPVVKEAELLRVLPKGFLPCAPKSILLMADDAGSGVGTAVRVPKVFRPWGKYFDSWSLNITRRAA
jgi:hypothetical protein